ncbi:MAG: hypothetical protein DWQ04_33490 [Chloroflexi bacterium]|nr:MAG: hypothetical protein DWQ04_33490 [Chloroflexota bacterium]
MKRKISLKTLLLILLITAAGCQNDEPMPTVVPTADVSEADDAFNSETSGAENDDGETAVSTPTPAPSPTPEPVKQLVVNMAAEPTSLYLYGDSSLQAAAIRHGIYENLFTSLGYDYQAQGLEKLPSLADGDAVINTVTVAEGDVVLNASGDPMRLAPGLQIITADGSFLTYDGEEGVEMLQMVVDFTFKPLVWSDGVAVTGTDSLFSFNIAADANTPSDKTKTERTASYEAMGDLSVRWTGVPGFLDETYFLNVWQPLPNHQLSRFTAADLLTADETAVSPLSHGPFVVSEWETGSHMLLTANLNYYRADAGLPHVGEVLIQFEDDLDRNLAQVAAGDADILTQDIFQAQPMQTTADLVADKGLSATFQPISVFEHIDFGINSAEEYEETRPDWFEASGVRQAMTLCTDRQRMVDELMFGQVDVLHAYVPDSHPLYPDDAFTQPFDPEAANALLEELGFVDTDDNGIREFLEIEEGQIKSTTPFSITLGTDIESLQRQRINEMFAEDMAACGIHVELYEIPVIDWYADGPFSPLFGRRFDLATFAWLTNIRPPCNLYLSSNITGPEEHGFGGWGNVNATGWSNESFDESCEMALAALPGTPEYAEYHQEAIRLFTEQLPVIPLFAQMKTAVTHPAVLNFKPDSTQPSALWNLFELDVEE